MHNRWCLIDGCASKRHGHDNLSATIVQQKHAFIFYCSHRDLTGGKTDCVIYLSEYAYPQEDTLALYTLITLISSVYVFPRSSYF